MGIPGAGKSRLAAEYAAQDYVRLNRDERGGTLRGIAEALEEQLSSGAGRVVLDNTYLTRASRNHVIETAERHGLPARCVWLDTPLAQAQANMVERLLDRVGSLPTPEELRTLARKEPGLHTPTSQMRTLRELEPPTEDEGFASIERVAFERAPRAGGRAGVFVAAAALRSFEPVDPHVPHLVFDWRPDGGPTLDVARLEADVVETAVCPHPGGPPTCWCRPPLPGLLLAFARAHDVDLARSVLVGTSAAHKTLAATVGARYLRADQA
jgi:predicted kinase